MATPTNFISNSQDLIYSFKTGDGSLTTNYVSGNYSKDVGNIFAPYPYYSFSGGTLPVTSYTLQAVGSGLLQATLILGPGTVDNITITLPNNMTSLNVTGVGGGGGGGSGFDYNYGTGYYAGGGGGGGGSFTFSSSLVSNPYNFTSVTIGAGGAGGTGGSSVPYNGSGNPGIAGGNTLITYNGTSYYGNYGYYGTPGYQNDSSGSGNGTGGSGGSGSSANGSGGNNGSRSSGGKGGGSGSGGSGGSGGGSGTFAGGVAGSQGGGGGGGSGYNGGGGGGQGGDGYIQFVYQFTYPSQFN